MTGVPRHHGISSGVGPHDPLVQVCGGVGLVDLEQRAGASHEPLEALHVDLVGRQCQPVAVALGRDRVRTQAASEP